MDGAHFCEGERERGGKERDSDREGGLYDFLCVKVKKFCTNLSLVLHVVYVINYFINL